MNDLLAAEAQDGETVTPIHVLAAGDHTAAMAALGPLAHALASAQGFAGKPGQVLMVYGEDGAPVRLLAGIGALEGPEAALALRGLAETAPAGLYALAETPPDFDRDLGALAFALGGRVFDRYRREPTWPRARLRVADAAVRARASSIAGACALARDLVDTPANAMGPADLEAAARTVAQAHGAEIQAIVGDALLDANYPAVHAVGRAADPARAPRFVEMTWRGSGAGEAAPKVVLVGKGVVFDTGGLDIKPSAGMRNMKKDMGGAAHALALAAMAMDADLPVRLTVLLPIVENAIGGDAMRPGDVLATRNGLSVEVGNTDAEGRLILADALTRAAELEPDLTLDLATLTGAARVALGPQLPPFYTDDETLAAEIAEAARSVHDPLWRMPLWAPYDGALDSEVADLKNDADAWAQAGSITAALFLKRFAPRQGAWAHLDIFAWNPRKRAGWPVGGEAQAIRALFRMLERRYGTAGG